MLSLWKRWRLSRTVRNSLAVGDFCGGAEELLRYRIDEMEAACSTKYSESDKAALKNAVEQLALNVRRTRQPPYTTREVIEMYEEIDKPLQAWTAYMSMRRLNLDLSVEQRGMLSKEFQELLSEPVDGDLQQEIRRLESLLEQSGFPLGLLANET